MDESTGPPRISQFRSVFAPWMCCVAIVFVFHLQRLLHPTFVGDDVIRIVDARVLPLREQLFRPFSEHIAPGFELATAALIRPLGDRIDLLPVALTAFAFASWLVMLAAVAWWANNVTGRADAARLVFVFVGVSSACIEVPWWFSAATYSLAAACVFAVLALVAAPVRNRWSRTVGIASITALGMSFSAVGLMAVILGGLAVIGRFGLKKAAGADLAALAGGFVSYTIFARALGGEIVATESTRFSLAGFAYALAVPGGVAAPLFLGLDAHAVTGAFSFAAGSAISILLAAFLWRLCVSRTLRLDLAAMAMVPYLAIYPTRAAFVESGAWGQADFLYFWTSRYHLFMTAVLAVAAALAVSKVMDLFGSRGFRIAPALPWLVLIAFAAGQIRNANLMRHFENQPDQAPTLSALMRLGRIAESEGIPVDQLQRLVPAVRRGWNASVLELRPDRYHHLLLLARGAPAVPETRTKRSDTDAARSIIERLGLFDWHILNSHRLTNLDPAAAANFETGQAIVPDELTFERAEPIDAKSWMILEPFGHAQFSLKDLTPKSHVIFETVSGAGTIHLQWTTGDSFDESRTFEFDSTPSMHCPVPIRVVFRPTDLKTVESSGTPATVRFRVKSTQAGTLRIDRILTGAIHESARKVSN